MAKKRLKYNIRHKAKPKKQEYNLWKIATVALAVLFVASILTGGFSSSKKSHLPKKKVSEITLDFVNAVVLQSKTRATVKSIQDLENQDCLYNITLDIQGRTFESFVTKDASLLFPQAINMKAPLPLPINQQQQ